MTSMDGQSGGRARRGFVSLRTKLIGFVSLIIVAVCSGLGWYFINQRAEMMNSSLVNTGTILAQNLAYNSRHLLFIEDLEGLGKLIEASWSWTRSSMSWLQGLRASGRSPRAREPCL